MVNGKIYHEIFLLHMSNYVKNPLGITSQDHNEVNFIHFPYLQSFVLMICYWSCQAQTDNPIVRTWQN